MGAEVGGRFELPPSIPEGGRNSALFSYGRSIRASRSADLDEVTNELLRANAERCAPPLPESEVVATAKSVCSVEPGLSPEYEARRGERERAVAEGRASEFDGIMITDNDLSALFAKKYSSSLRFVIEAGGWYAYDGSRWVPSSQGGNLIAKNTMRWFTKNELWAWACGFDGGERKSKDIISYALGYLGHNQRERLLKDAQSLMGARMTEFDRDPLLFNCPSYTLDLHDGDVKARLHDPADMLTKMAGCDYDPEANYDEWREFLLETFEGDAERVAFLQMAVGAALAGDTSAHRFYIANGPTRTGKSTTLDTILAAFGDYGGSMQPTTLADGKRGKGGPSSDLARLAGLRFVVCPELPARMRLDVAQMKQWTGGDTITARWLNENDFDFIPQFQLWVNTNYLPDVNDQTLFSSDRCVVLPFERRIPAESRDRRLKDRLMQPRSLSSVLNWALDGYLVASASDGKLPEACRAAVAEYADDSDVVGAFIEEFCVTGEGLKESGPALYAKYAGWAEGNGRGVMSDRSFYNELSRCPGITRLGRGSIGSRRVRNVFGGVRLNG